MMIVMGGWWIISGLVAVFSSEFHVVGVIIAIVNLLVAFAWLPWYPFLVDHRPRTRHHEGVGVEATAIP